MSDLDAPRRKRFPLTLDDTRPVTRRLVAATSQAPAKATPMPRDAALARTPPVVRGQGHGLDSDSFRARMVDRLRLDGCQDAEVLRAFSDVPRHLFVDPALVSQAYEDTSLPIGLGQTISKPSVVARMLALLRARPGGTDLQRVLEIGTGCGYQAALLCALARNVYSVERLKALHDKARENLAPIRPSHLRLIYGDGRLGHAPNAPYDGIVSAAGGLGIPQAWLDQLAPGGRLVAPVQSAPGSSEQVLIVVDRMADGRWVEQRHETVRFVPLESGTRDHRPA